MAVLPLRFVPCLLSLGLQTAGLNMQLGVIGDVKALGVRESFKSKLQVYIGVVHLLTAPSSVCSCRLMVHDDTNYLSSVGVSLSFGLDYVVLTQFRSQPHSTVGAEIYGRIQAAHVASCNQSFVVPFENGYFGSSRAEVF